MTHALTSRLARPFIALTLAASVLFGAASEVDAQEAGAPFTVEFSGETEFLAEFGVVRAFVGLAECGSVDLRAGEQMLVVGAAGTVEACRDAGRVVDLIPDGFSPIGIAPVLLPGETFVISNLAPYPAVDGPDVAFAIEVRVPPEDASILPLIKSLTAYVGGEVCGTVDLTGDERWLPVGAAGTPDACREAGAAITLVDGNGHTLFVRPSVGPGPFTVLENLVPLPPSSGAPTDVPHADAPAPSAVGDYVVGAEGGRLAMLFALLAATVIAAGVARAGVRREGPTPQHP
ncbi:MAG: hypothetical protein O2798_07515 [Chloroflexi bacterium]|nr:hypothetical protein [Chloroflexota bacterium]MDA1240676.1 hypothetical protein [Chloroflexota bacterium]